MPRILILLATLLGMMATHALAAPALSAVSQQPHTRLELISESATYAAGKPLTLALAMTPKPGWHSYWINPGDSGAPTRLDWRLPAGWKAGAARYPTPERFKVADLTGYVYSKPVMLLVPLTVGAGGGVPATIELKADWLVCDDQTCVPESGSVALTLPAGDGAADPVRADMFREARGRLPQPVDATARYFHDDRSFQLRIDLASAAPPIAQAYFYPVEDGLIAYGAPQKVVRSPDGRSVLITTQAGYGESKTVGSDGILALEWAQGGQAAWSLSATRVTQPLGLAELPAGGGPGGGGSGGGGPGGVAPSLPLMLAYALLGGLILNVMPCVFPILSLKALALARAGADRRIARIEAIGYTIGVLATFCLIGIVLAALRSGGASLGWGAQLQHPHAVGALALVMTAIGLNLVGVFEVGGRLANVGQQLTEKPGAAGAFWTGALAVVVASPCSVPFMGTAIGATLVLNPIFGLLIFVALGLGLALPYLLLAFVPRAHRLLPRPGSWMETFRRLLAFPMFATALWLFWLVGVQAGVDAMTVALGAALLLALALWLYGRGQSGGGLFATLGAACAAFAALVSLASLNPAPAAAGSAAVAAARHEPYSTQALQALITRKKPVFVYFTADWCVTCKVNERLALNTPEVQQAFDRERVTVLVGDWTRQNSEITETLRRYGRAGVPLYLYFAPGSDLSSPLILPQILTKKLLTDLVPPA